MIIAGLFLIVKTWLGSFLPDFGAWFWIGIALVIIAVGSIISIVNARKQAQGEEHQKQLKRKRDDTCPNSLYREQPEKRKNFQHKANKRNQRGRHQNQPCLSKRTVEAAKCQHTHQHQKNGGKGGDARID